MSAKYSPHWHIFHINFYGDKIYHHEIFENESDARNACQIYLTSIAPSLLMQEFVLSEHKAYGAYIFDKIYETLFDGEYVLICEE